MVSLPAIIDLLQRDPLRHIVTLKMINSYGDQMTFDVKKSGDSWGILSKLPVRVSEYDRKTYPDADFIILIDGVPEIDKRNLVDDLPDGTYIVKTYDETVKEHLEMRYGARRVNSFLSYTAKCAPSLPTNFDVEESFDLDGETLSFFQHNGYEESELIRFFQQRAKWFGIRRGSVLVSGCFVFQNFDTLWELGGVFTLPAYRRQGYAKVNVLSALRYLLSNNYTPRYLVKWDNKQSIQLAESFGFEPFLTIDHYVLRK
jgi:hypothetical protein